MTKMKCHGESFAPILVVGHPRSGTTLLAAILDRHPSIAIPPETSWFLRHLRTERRRLDALGQHQPILDQWKRISTFDFLPAKLARRFREGPPTTEEFFKCLLIEFAHTRGKPRYGEKSPWHLLVVPELIARYPGSKVICIVRDGRDVVPSCKRAAFNNWQPDWWHIVSWCKAVRRAKSYEARFPDRFIVTRFEDILTEPLNEVRRLMDFIGETFCETQLDSTIPTSVTVESQPWILQAREAINISKNSAWRKSLTSAEAKYLTTMMYRDLQSLSYDVTMVDSARGRRAFYKAKMALMQIGFLSTRVTSRMVTTARRLGLLSDVNLHQLHQ